MKFTIQKTSLLLTILLVTFLSCQQEENTLSPQEGTVQFGGISLEFETMGSPGSRIIGFSPWKHIFPDAANLVFTNKISGQEYILPFNPKDFSTPYSITLPLGNYAYKVSVLGELFSDFLPFEASGEFTLDSPSLEISLKAETDYGLVTVKDLYVVTTEISMGNNQKGLVLPEGGSHWYIYVRGGTNATLKIKEALKGSTISRELSVQSKRHYNFVLKLNDGSAVISDLEVVPFELEEEEIPVGYSTKFYRENGTIKCPETVPGEKGMVDGKVYEAVDRALLIQRRDEDADLTCVCTTLVTDMGRMFFQKNNFNQPIGIWDVSNVTDMSEMFFEAYTFNQPIEMWDVSNVKNMQEMFRRARAYNQPIGNWDVGNVTTMRYMFHNISNFNQPIGDWDVSKVTDMSSMFASSPFNQPIGNWDVSKVENMLEMFESNRRFNQPIGDWDVSRVVSMQGMFYEAREFDQPIGDWNVRNVENMFYMFLEAFSFNQPLGNWDVSNVTNMVSMFSLALNFDQDLTTWCVQNIPSQPQNFSDGSPLTQSNKPIWGTCPD
jgi:surface protein